MAAAMFPVKPLEDKFLVTFSKPHSKLLMIMITNGFEEWLCVHVY